MAPLEDGPRNVRQGAKQEVWVRLGRVIEDHITGAKSQLGDRRYDVEHGTHQQRLSYALAGIESGDGPVVDRSRKSTRR